MADVACALWLRWRMLANLCGAVTVGDVLHGVPGPPLTGGGPDIVLCHSVRLQRSELRLLCFVSAVHVGYRLPVWLTSYVELSWVVHKIPLGCWPACL